MLAEKLPSVARERIVGEQLWRKDGQQTVERCERDFVGRASCICDELLLVKYKKWTSETALGRGKIDRMHVQWFVRDFQMVQAHVQRGGPIPTKFPYASITFHFMLRARYEDRKCHRIDTASILPEEQRIWSLPCTFRLRHSSPVSTHYSHATSKCTRIPIPHSIRVLYQERLYCGTEPNHGDRGEEEGIWQSDTFGRT